MTSDVIGEVVEIDVEFDVPGIFDYHLELVELYRDAAPQARHSDADALAAFNGYYTLDSAPGAFFAIDTNIHINDLARDPIVDISLLVSLDGTTSARFPFTGRFDGGRLVQLSAAEAGFSVDLEFKRADATDGATASCAGSITLPGLSAKVVTGVTYNNPIPYSVFEGIYYPSSFTGGAAAGSAPVAKIDSDYRLSYDNGDGTGSLTPVVPYTYNLNMYYFSFGPADAAVSLIMGTAAGKGLACNNMYKDTATGQMVSRPLTTIPNAATPTNAANNPAAEQLAALSGYYELPTLAQGAFLSLQGEYKVEAGAITGYGVNIGVSIDGLSARSFYFDDTMTFANGQLTVPNVLDVTLTRGYDAAQGSLVSLTGTILGFAVTGNTRFNPVPLSAFGGVPLTDLAGDTTLVITSDTQVTYNGAAMTLGTYVPVMYILAGFTPTSNFMLSFGTAGLKGNACIVMPLTPTPGATTKFVYAIPGAGN